MIVLRGKFFFCLPTIASTGYFVFVRGLDEPMGTCPGKSSASLYLPLDRNRDLLRRSCLKLSGLCLLVKLHVDPLSHLTGSTKTITGA